MKSANQVKYRKTTKTTLCLKNVLTFKLSVTL